MPPLAPRDHCSRLVVGPRGPGGGRPAGVAHTHDPFCGPPYVPSAAKPMLQHRPSISITTRRACVKTNKTSHRKEFLAFAKISGNTSSRTLNTTGRVARLPQIHRGRGISVPDARLNPLSLEAQCGRLTLGILQARCFPCLTNPSVACRIFTSYDANPSRALARLT